MVELVEELYQYICPEAEAFNTTVPAPHLETSAATGGAGCGSITAWTATLVL
jgi:hypothetical protein